MSPLFRPLRERNPFWLGVVAAAIVVLLVLGTLGFGALGLGQSRYRAEFAQAGDLRPGDPVRVAGMDIGEITSTGLEGDHVLVSFRIQRDIKVGADSTASIKLATLLGGRYLELTPAGTGELPNGRIVLAHTTVPYDLQTVIQTGTPLVEDLDSAKLRAALQAVSNNLRGDGPRVSAALDGLSRLSAVVVARRDQYAQLITNADTVTTLVNQRSDKLFALMGQSDTLLRELLRRRDVIRGMLTDLASLTDELRKTIDENQSQVGSLLDNARDLTDVLRKQDDSVDRALQLLAPAGRYLTNAFGNGPYADVYLPYSILPDNILCRVGAVSGCK
ncbi:MAG TPA: MCE family protein [Pseudonocardia sp.]|jgi:phospholipid/cholesterol/gamma-HCH transport system substrate-binding protein|nr:MCE family protein [Pseudonocardia sp.]